MSERYEVGTPQASGKRVVSPQTKGQPGPRAVFVAHGMGQQVPFETIADVARGICKNASARVTTTRARTVRVGCEIVQRLEIEFENDAARPIHVFEAYWAPLTEGAVGLWHVVRFLLLGGWNGIRSGGRFHRFVFGANREFRIRPWHMFLLSLAIVVVLAIVITGSVVAGAGAAWLFGFTWITDALVADLTAAFELLLAILIASMIVSLALIGLSRKATRLAILLRGLTVVIGAIVAAAFVITAYVRIPLSILFHEKMPFAALETCVWCTRTEGASLRAGIGRFLRRVYDALQSVCIAEIWVWWSLFAASLALLVLAVYSTVRARKLAEDDRGCGVEHFHADGKWSRLLLAAIAVVVVVAMCGRSDTIALATWIILFAFTVFVRRFLIQYVGDVAAYVSPHVVDRFFDLRLRIKDRVWRAARAVYALRDASGQFVYDEVAVVGHSLGSVVVYDTLNRLLNDDAMAPAEECDESCGDVAIENLRVSDRTKLLLTFGSPLDKTAFVFAMHGRDRGTDRDMLATSVQPLIKDERKFRWINVSSRWDVISGPLEFYDPPERQKDDRRAVDNRLDPEAVTPLVAHVEYWASQTIYKALLEHLPA